MFETFFYFILEHFFVIINISIVQRKGDGAMKRKGIIGIFFLAFMLCVIIVVIKGDSGVLGSKREYSENDIEVDAIYYINDTGKSSKYIGFAECEEIGTGTIVFDKSIDKLTVRNSPDEVAEYLESIPNYNDFINENEDIKWFTIYRSNGVYRVIGERVEAEYPEATDDFLLLLDDSNEGNVERENPEEGIAVEEEPFEELIIEEPKVEEPVIPDEYDTVSDLVNGDLLLGMTVYTKGYYNLDDGGAATYVISDSQGSVFEKLNNGLYANLQYDDSINIKQLGAIGNGKDDDSSYIMKAFALRSSTIIIPEGSYNLSKKNITVPGGVSIIGTDCENCILKNVNFTAANGISVSNITFDGAAKRKVTTPGEVLSNTIMIDVSPKGTQSVYYSHCIFRNADIASFAFANWEGSFESDVVENCIFENIGRVAIYHSANANNSSYCGNSFSEIGSTSITWGPISAIWVGDVTNNTYTRSKNIIIQNNKFKNLYTADDFESSHAVNANFITIRGDVAFIADNEIENLYGYGSDREAIYTKIAQLTIDNNTITNGGCGEGYMCNKGADGDLYAIITNNKFYGECGYAIRQYGPANISNNKIYIKHCPTAILVTAKGTQTVDHTVEINDNLFATGEEGTYYHNGREVSAFNEDQLIKVLSAMGAVVVSGNEINTEAAYSTYVAIGNATGDIMVAKNKIYTIGRKGTPVSVYNNSKGVVNSRQSIVFNENEISVDAGQKAISVSLTKQDTKRSFVLDNNTFNFSDPSTYNYPLTLTINGGNNDTLEASGNSANSNKKRTTIKYSANTLINNDEEFATFTKK